LERPRLVIDTGAGSEIGDRVLELQRLQRHLAARLLLQLPCRFILFDTGTYLRMEPEEDARRFGQLGRWALT
jgi:hypothetical protein